MLRVNIVGIGPGNPKLLTGAALEAINQSTILIGDKRMLANFASEKRFYDTIKTAEICNICANANPEKDIVSILVSGDVGFFSLAKTISGKLPDCECVRFCGISSLVYFAQQLQMSWDDAKIISMHGRRQNFIEAVAHNEKVFALTGGENSPQALCAKLCRFGLGGVQVYVGENLSYDNENISSMKAEEAAQKQFSSLSVMMIINKDAKTLAHNVHGLNDDLFMRSKVPMTKQEIRAVSISKLMPQETDVIYDIGAGTGSCSIELALQAGRGMVYAFERNPEAVQLIEKNKELFGVENLTVIAGEASEKLEEMPVPDCVFIGGSGGNLCKMLDTIYAKNENCRVVINAITVETLIEVVEYYKQHEAYALDIVNVFAARAKKLGAYNLMMSQNPVYIMTALKRVSKMAELKLPRFMLAAPASGSGKTTLTCAVLKALMNKGLKTAAFKSGPDYIDPMFHSRVIGTKSRNMDLFILPEETAKYLLAKNGKDCDIAVLEGAMGFFDGMGTTLKGSAYDLARLTKTPVILVVNAKGAALSIAAMIEGFKNFRKDVNVAGAVLNNVTAMSYLFIKKPLKKKPAYLCLAICRIWKTAILKAAI